MEITWTVTVRLLLGAAAAAFGVALLCAASGFPADLLIYAFGAAFVLIMFFGFIPALHIVRKGGPTWWRALAYGAANPVTLYVFILLFGPYAEIVDGVPTVVDGRRTLAGWRIGLGGVFVVAAIGAAAGLFAYVVWIVTARGKTIRVLIASGILIGIIALAAL